MDACQGMASPRTQISHAMNQERHAKVRAIFLDVIKTPNDQKEAVLSKACGSDADWRREVEALLAQHLPDTIPIAGPGLAVPPQVDASQDDSAASWSGQPDLPSSTTESDRDFEPGFIVTKR